MRGNWETFQALVHVRILITTLLILILLTWRIWRAPNNASSWQMGFNWAFIGLKMQLPGSCAVAFFIRRQQVMRDFLYKQPWPLPITFLLFQQSTSGLGRRSGRLIAIRTPHSNSVRSTVCRLLFPSTNPVIQRSGDISITFGLQSRFFDSSRHYRRNSSHHLETCQNFIPS